NQVRPFFNIVNVGISAVPLSELKLRYYFTAGKASPLVFSCDWAVIRCHNLSGTFAKLNPGASNADTYLEISFKDKAGLIAPGAQSGEMQTRFNYADRSNFNETDDYSYDGTKLALADWSHVVLYRNGVRVWGAEPTGTMAATTVASHTAATASATTITP